MYCRSGQLKFNGQCPFTRVPISPTLDQYNGRRFVNSLFKKEHGVNLSKNKKILFLGGAFLLLNYQRLCEMTTTKDWISEVRKEFPGLRSAKNWILCDSPGGTQAHQV